MEAFDIIVEINLAVNTRKLGLAFALLNFGPKVITTPIQSVHSKRFFFGLTSWKLKVLPHATTITVK